MRKKDREITDSEAMEDIIRRSVVCRLAVCHDNEPYIVPLCFGYRDRTVYVHSAPEGKKITMLRENNRVCLEFDIDTEVVKADRACRWTMKYRSVIACGRAYLVEDTEEKRAALDIIMSHYGSAQSDYEKKPLEYCAVIRVEIDSMTGKKSGW